MEFHLGNYLANFLLHSVGEIIAEAEELYLTAAYKFKMAGKWDRAGLSYANAAKMAHCIGSFFPLSQEMVMVVTIVFFLYNSGIPFLISRPVPY